MTITQGVILGIVQGLTEFLPVSSSGHLVVVGELLNLDMEGDPGFVIIAHAGTLLAVLIFFRQRLMNIATGILRWDRSGIRWTVLLIIGTIPAAAIGLPLQHKIETHFYNSTIVGTTWLATAVMLWAGERLGRAMVAVEGMGIGRAFIIGLAQAFALLPGISRSGSTLSSGMLVGVKRRELLDYIFVLSIPPIAGGTLLESLKWSSGSAPFTMAHLGGGIVAAVSGYCAIAIMLKVVNAGRLGWFALYCLVAGVATLVITVM